MDRPKGRSRVPFLPGSPCLSSCHNESSVLSAIGTCTHTHTHTQPPLTQPLPPTHAIEYVVVVARKCRCRASQRTATAAAATAVAVPKAAAVTSVCNRQAAKYCQAVDRADRPSGHASLIVRTEVERLHCSQLPIYCTNNMLTRREDAADDDNDEPRSDFSTSPVSWRGIPALKMGVRASEHAAYCITNER